MRAQSSKAASPLTQALPATRQRGGGSSALAKGPPPPVSTGAGRVQALGPVPNEPEQLEGHGLLGPLQRRLRVDPGGQGNAFFSRLQQKAAPPHGVRMPGDDQLRTADPEAREPARLVRRRRRVAERAAGGHQPAAGQPPDTTARTRAGAKAHVARLFAASAGESGDDGACALAAQLLGLSSLEHVPHAAPVLLATALWRIVGDDAPAALALLRDLRSPEPRGAAFAAELTLARCHGGGLDCLMALRPPPAAADALAQAVQREAFATRLRTAGALCDLLPAKHCPDSLSACLALARELLEARRQRRPAGLPAARLLAGQRDGLLLARALLCADALLADPGARIPRKQQWAYMAARNGVQDEKTLARTQRELFKLNTYIQRAAEKGGKRLRHGGMRLLGLRLDPLRALPTLGTAQSKTRHPPDDVSLRTTAMDSFVLQIGRRLQGLPQGPGQPPAVLRQALRVAVVRQWKQRIRDRGWQDQVRLGRRARRAVAAEVAAQLGCTPALARAHPELCGLRRLQACLLDRWVREEGLDLAASTGLGDGRSLGEALQDFLGLHHGGDVILREPSAAQVRELLIRALEGTRQTYSVNFVSSATLGLQGGVNFVIPASAVLGVGLGPSLALLGTRSAEVRVGSNVHGGQLVVGRQRAERLELGLVAGLGLRLEEVINIGPSLTLQCFQFERSHGRGVAVRSHMNPAGDSQPEAWRRLLREALETLTIRAGTQEPPPDAQTLWRQLAERYFCNPNLSIDGLQNRQTLVGLSATAALAARALLPGGLQGGPQLAAGVAVTLQGRSRQRDVIGFDRCTQQEGENSGRLLHITGGVLMQAPGITGGPLQQHAGEPGAAQSAGFPSLNAGSASLQRREGSALTIRLVYSQGRVEEDTTVMDTEFGSAGDFAHYLDSQRADWLEALGGGPEAARELDRFVSCLLLEETRSNVTYGERRRLTPRAARNIDHYRAMIALLRDPAWPAARECAAEARRLDDEITRVLLDPASWDRRSLWVLDLVQNSVAGGWPLLAVLWKRKAVTALRQSMVLFAKSAPNRERELTAEF